MAMWLVAVCLPISYWVALWAAQYGGYARAVHLLLVCAAIVCPLVFMVFVVMLSPDWLFEAAVNPFLYCYWFVVGVDPDDPVIQSDSESESMEVGAEGYVWKGGEGGEDGEEEGEFEPDPIDGGGDGEWFVTVA